MGLGFPPSLLFYSTLLRMVMAMVMATVMAMVRVMTQSVLQAVGTRFLWDWDGDEDWDWESDQVRCRADAGWARYSAQARENMPHHLPTVR